VLRHAPATVALRAAGVLANGLSPLVNGFRRGKGGDLDRVLLGVAEAFADPALATNLEALCKAFAPYTHVVWTDDQGRQMSRDLGGERGCFEEHFSGRFDALVTWLRAAVEYDLGGFLDDMKMKIAAARAVAKVESPSESPKGVATSGSFGAS
jgi:hypothetical protein